MKLSLPKINLETILPKKEKEKDKEEGKEQESLIDEKVVDPEYEAHVKELYYKVEREIKRKGIRMTADALNEKVWEQVDFLLAREEEEAASLARKNKKTTEKPLTQILQESVSTVVLQAKSKILPEEERREQSQYINRMKDNLAAVEAKEKGEDYASNPYADYPPEVLDSDGKPLPFTKNEDGSISPCELDDKGNPIDPIIMSDGSYMYYDPTLAKSKSWKENLKTRWENIGESIIPATEELKGVLEDVSTEIEKVVRGL